MRSHYPATKYTHAHLPYNIQGEHDVSVPPPCIRVYRAYTYAVQCQNICVQANNSNVLQQGFW